MDRYSRSDPVRRRLRRLTRGERVEEAIAFLRQFAAERGQDPKLTSAREKEVCRELCRTGRYTHTPDELEFGARIAWRNHARCIGRLTWKSLEVNDRRNVVRAADVLSSVLYDLSNNYRDGKISSAITIFSPITDDHTPVTFESHQLFQYAGYLKDDGKIIGDRNNIEITKSAIKLGWNPPYQQGNFDLLPVIMRDSDGTRHAFNLNHELAHEVAITHAAYPGLAALGLKWYSVPCITDMILTIGGIDYPCAPFNGYYMATEIASRNLVDERRYNLMTDIGVALGLDIERGDAFWRDTTLTELNRAVIDSFRSAGVRITDHHEASAQFMEFSRQEGRAGRVPSAEWSWIVPPQAGSACPVFHLPMKNLHSVPNFYVSRHGDGAELGIDRTHFRESVWRKRWEREKKRFRDWRRRRDRLWDRA